MDLYLFSDFDSNHPFIRTILPRLNLIHLILVKADLTPSIIDMAAILIQNITNSKTYIWI
jgi:hypothetical protein